MHCQNHEQQWVLSILTTKQRELPRSQQNRKVSCTAGVPTMTPSWAKAAHLPGLAHFDIFEPSLDAATRPQLSIQ